MKVKLSNTSSETVNIRLIPSTNATATETDGDDAVTIQENGVVNITLTEKEGEL